MTQREFLSELRELIGNPTQAVTADRQLMPYVRAALDFLARKLRYALKEDSQSLVLKAGVQEYDLPSDVSQLMWVRIAGKKLSPSTTYLWDRDGNDWKNATAGVPAEVAFEGRKLILDRAPSSQFLAGNSGANARGDYKFISSSPGIRPTHIPGLPDADARLAVLYAAVRYCTANPTDENTKRRGGLSDLLAMDLREAQERHAMPIEDLQPSISVNPGRQGAAR